MTETKATFLKKSWDKSILEFWIKSILQEIFEGILRGFFGIIVEESFE